MFSRYDVQTHTCRNRCKVRRRDDDHMVTTKSPEAVAFFIPKASQLIISDEKWVTVKDQYSFVLQWLLSLKRQPGSVIC
ncbi:hypothetical protein CLF_110317 [Clonorchis sinensis]|uniref:Uncharacterized protein n=1 Tax=Clonorchis sinensis TaxID=79923 RepID=H2KSU2_CLOSI|nr:hypothetical protein CLF_110317 [Clonorchis sinensis]